MSNEGWHRATELGVALTEACKLLEMAQCPNCEGVGYTSHQVAEGVWEQEQCQWCYERKALLDEHG